MNNFTQETRMDPTAALKAIFEAAAEGDREKLMEHLEALFGWLTNSGSMPLPLPKPSTPAPIPVQDQTAAAELTRLREQMRSIARLVMTGGDDAKSRQTALRLIGMELGAGGFLEVEFKLPGSGRRSNPG